MKKTLLSLAAIMVAAVSSGQVQRMLLFEEFTGENCPPCASTNPIIQVVANNNPNKIIFLRYQCNIPSAPPVGSLYQDNPSEVGTRQTYYSVPFAPYARLDGKIIGGGSNAGHAGYLTQDTVNKYWQVNSPFSLSVTHTVNATNDSVKITANINCAVATTGTLKLHLAMVETEIHFVTAPGTNGEKDFYNPMRKMVPNASGTALAGSWTAGQAQTLNFNVKLPTYLKNLNKLAIIGFIQNDANKFVHQSALSAPVPLVLDGQASSVAGIGPFVCAPPSPSLVIANPGQTTINSANISYKLNTGTVQTATYTGAITAGGTDVISTPISGMVTGSNSVNYTITAINGVTDYTVNNTHTSTFVYNTAPTGSVTPYSYNFISVAFPPTGWIYDKKGLTLGRAAAGNGNTGSLYANFYNDASGYSTLTMVPVDLTLLTNPMLSFDRAYSGYYDVTNGLLYDTLKVYISTNCGTTWTQIYNKTNTQLATVPTQSTSYTPANSTHWQNDQISLAPYASSNKAYIMFYAGTAYGNQMYVDNINVAGTTGLKDLNIQSQNVSVYPNPSSGLSTLLINCEKEQKVDITVTNSLGQMVYQANGHLNLGQNAISIDSENWQEGVYHISIKGADFQASTRLTIAK